MVIVKNYTLQRRTWRLGLCTPAQEEIIRVKRFKIHLDHLANKSLSLRQYFWWIWKNFLALYSETFFTGKPHWIDQIPEELTDRKGGRMLVRIFLLITSYINSIAKTQDFVFRKNFWNLFSEMWIPFSKYSPTYWMCGALLYDCISTRARCLKFWIFRQGTFFITYNNFQFVNI